MAKKNKEVIDAEYVDVDKKEEVLVHESLEQSPIHVVIMDFTNSLEDYREAVFFSIPKMAQNRLKELKKTSKKIESLEKKLGIKEGEDIKGSARDVKNLFDLDRELHRLMNSKLLPLVARSFFIGMFSEYDRFIGNLLKVIHQKKPELYRGIRKEILMTDLLDYASIDDIKQEMLEQEIDAFRRGSYIEQFSEIEKKFDVTLKKFDDWSKFIEIAQRRNVMTHNGGCVSKQYLYVCEKEGFVFQERPVIGSELALTPEYVFQSIRVLSKVGLMLAHTLWRKLFPGEIKTADNSLNSTLYNLLRNQRWNAAVELGTFSLSPLMIKESSDLVKRIRVINTAIATKFTGNLAEAMQILDSVDWSASIREFKLACCVIKEEYEDAAKIMEEIGREGEMIEELAYYE